MPEPQIRKSAIVTETIWHEGGPVAETPLRRAAAMTVIANPFAGRYVEDIQPFMEDLKPLGEQMAQDLIDALGGDPSVIEGYGKGAIVGVDGDREHSAAILHPRFGAPVRAAIGGGADIIPGTKKLGGPGAPITMPIGNKDDRWVFDDMDAVDIAIPDAPHADEIVIALALSCGGRPGARVRKP